MVINIVCAWYEVGMRHYSFSVLKNLSNLLSKEYQLKVTLVLRNEVINYPELSQLSNVDINYIVIKNPLLNVLSKIFPTIFDSYILRKIKADRSDLLYILFGGLFFKNVRSFKKIVKVLYTIHDLNPHEKNKSSIKDHMLSRLENKRDGNLVKESNYLLTNSKGQYNQLIDLVDPKNVFFAEMPSLINSQISDGTLKVPELIGEEDYILFFGRIDKYKGLDILINTHLSSGLQTKLVIAGSGKFWFDIPNADNIILINRYIKDEEFKDLFLKAKLAVMPYISITQTSLISIPFHFQCPVIFSDIDAFRTLTKECGSLICNFNDLSDYKIKINSLFDQQSCASIVLKQNDFYDRIYNPKRFTNTMESIFDYIYMDK